MNNIMIMGTASNVGKSIVAAGIIRCLTQDGYSVVPFKSQNMSLNSFIDIEGGEMGRAQVFQAEAAQKIPMSYMNPILLKPCGGGVSQIIVEGKFVGNMKSDEYREYKKELVPKLRKIYSDVKKKGDIVVLEGAGSPVEININSLDISNMEMAKIAKSPVILVADIDRGGVFASIVGTLSLLKKKERDMVKGIVINKFRGISGSFSDGVKIIEELTGKKVLGVLPHIDFNIDEEDGVSDRTFLKKFSPNDINIFVLKTPHMSNYTDFEVFEGIEGVSIKYIGLDEDIYFLDKNGKIAYPDILIIPGSKNTIDDIRQIKKCGMDTKIIEFSKGRGYLVGICGGYQILGNSILDATGIDMGGKGEFEKALGILDIDTVFSEEKNTAQVSGSVELDFGKYEVSGYELHFGVSKSISDRKNEKTLSNYGFEYSYRERVFGSYCHGIFDNLDFTYGMINNIRMEKQLPKIRTEFSSFNDKKMVEYNKIANLIRENLDMEELYGIIKKGV